MKCQASERLAVTLSRNGLIFFEREMQGEFSYSSQPHAAPVKKTPKYRDENEQQAPSSANNLQNLMHDPRVVRGNTYSAKVLTSTLKDSTSKQTRQLNPAARKKFVGRRVSTPPPVDGRSHMNMQTDDFLEELTDRPVEIDAETQTHAFMDRPASPLYVRAKTGRDMETQIGAKDLFDFDIEVEPILEVLVGKTLHVSMLELMQEEELDAIRKQQEEFEAVRNVELAEVKRLEAEARRKQQERDRRIQQELKRIADKKDLEEKIAARAFAYQYLGSLHTSVFDMLEEQGFFYDPLKKEVEEVFMKELLTGVKVKAACYEAAQAMAAELLEAARGRARDFELVAVANRQEYMARLEREAAQAEEAKRLELEAERARKLAAEAAENAGMGGDPEE